LDGGPVQEGTSIHVPEVPGNITYTLEFWSVDGFGNEETHHVETFTIYGGTGILRMVWGDSDYTGISPCVANNTAGLQWEIRRTGSGELISAGMDGCPNWSGVDDVEIPVSYITNTVDIFWYDAYGSDITTFYNVAVTYDGEIVRLSY